MCSCDQLTYACGHETIEWRYYCPLARAAADDPQHPTPCQLSTLRRSQIVHCNIDAACTRCASRSARPPQAAGPRRRSLAPGPHTSVRLSEPPPPAAPVNRAASTSGPRRTASAATSSSRRRPAAVAPEVDDGYLSVVSARDASAPRQSALLADAAAVPSSVGGRRASWAVGADAAPGGYLSVVSARDASTPRQSRLLADALAAASVVEAVVEDESRREARGRARHRGLVLMRGDGGESGGRDRDVVINLPKFVAQRLGRGLFGNSEVNKFEKAMERRGGSKQR